MWRIVLAMLDALYPPRCVGRACCRRGAWLCPDCQAAIVPVARPACTRCGAPLPVRGACHDCALIRPAFARAVAAGAYEPPLREAVQVLKYRGATALVTPLAGLVAAALAGEAVDLVVPVPAHRRRVQGRGVDHARLLAVGVGAALGAPARTDLLVRVRATRPQVGLAAEARQLNVAGAFRVRGPVPSVTVALVDDVLTTGATASACAAALLVAGADRVVVATVARASSRRARVGGNGGARV